MYNPLAAAIDREQQRMMALHELNLLDTAPAMSFDRITRMAGQLFGLPIAAVSLTDTDRQWFKSRVGLTQTQIPRLKAPCAQIAETGKLLVLPDLLEHRHFQDSLLAQAGIRFYAGAPLLTRDGYGLGSMCVLGCEPRQVSGEEVVALQDLAAMVMAQIELQHAFGRVDPLSGLPNRNQLVEDLQDMARDQPGQRKFAVLVDLIDGAQLSAALRVIGPSYIDDLVHAATRLLRQALGPKRKLYQIGAMHYATLLDDMDDAALAATTDAVLAQVARMAPCNGVLVASRAAIGVAPFRLGECSPRDILQAAHSAVQDAREADSGVRVYSAALDEAHRRRFKLLADMPAALAAADQLTLAFQPRVDMRSGDCVGAEALLRWHHPTLGNISPGEFIPIIEQTVLARDLTDWVLRTAVAQIAAWRGAGLHLTVSINVSAANLEESDFAARLDALVQRFAVPPEAIELELTESALLRNGGGAVEQMAAISAAGFRFAIDDFGTGYSSLSYLERIPADVVKIDQSFMRGLGHEKRSETLVGAMVRLIHSLGYRVVAEGVETEQVYEILLALGCDEVQGYLLGRPMPAAAFEKLVGRNAGVWRLAAAAAA